jgi:hypothetical protein
MRPMQSIRGSQHVLLVIGKNVEALNFSGFAKWFSIVLGEADPPSMPPTDLLRCCLVGIGQGRHSFSDALFKLCWRQHLNVISPT